MNRSGGIKVIASAKLGGKITLEALLCFPALRFGAFSPYRETRYCGAPKPGKEKQKSYDYRSAILIVHRFESFPSVFTPVMRRIWREVTRKMAAQSETWAFAKGSAGRRSVGAEKPQFSDAPALRCVRDSAKPDFG
jgi:hypothetical protein